MGKQITFKTLSKRKSIILKQEVNYNERYRSGAKEGQVKRRRIIRYCKDLESIFVDEQMKVTDKPKQTTIRIDNSVLKVNEDNITLLEYLRTTPENEANGGKIFKELDIEKEEAFELDRYKTIHNAKTCIFDASKNDVMNVAISMFGHAYKTKSVASNIKSLTTRIEHDIQFANSVIKFFKDNDNEKKTVSLALMENIIEVREGKKIAWADDGEVIYIGSQSKDVISEFVMWVRTDEEGRANLKLITDKL